MLNVRIKILDNIAEKDNDSKVAGMYTAEWYMANRNEMTEARCGMTFRNEGVGGVFHTTLSRENEVSVPLKSQSL